ncbi:hypothetical protein ACH5RR_031256 [Cinchona calisaya]|uniref:Uncharacterized protein n=1 Tax=Cinchona calisaya TaxID=153742 RepID=A0ABD2YEN8_9GENT
MREIVGLVVPKEPQKNQLKPTTEEVLTVLQHELLECNNELPFSQVTKFTATQAIVDNVASAKGHECPLELLKISAVGPSKEMIDKIGKMLSSFADGLNIPFAFKSIVSDMKDIKEDFFELAADEVLAVCSEL